MKRFLTFLLLAAFLAVPLGGFGTAYAAPSDTLHGHIVIDLNVTLVNTAPFPKFLILNPNYNVSVHRSYSNGSVEILNAHPGIWLMPYEVTVVTFKVEKNESYSLPAVNCRATDGTYMACGVSVPQLVNSPSQLSLKSMFPFIDGSIRVLSYRGKVTFTVSSDDEFRKFIAITVPVLFTDGKMDGFTPNYTMTYDEYVRALHDYTGVQKSEKSNSPGFSMPSNMFVLTNSLLTGVSVPAPKVEASRGKGYELPVWFVSMSDSFTVSYCVEWDLGG